MRTVWFTIFSMPTVQHRITSDVNTHQNENRFFAFGSQTSSAEIENADFCLYHSLLKTWWNTIVAFLFLFSIYMLVPPS